MLTSKAFDPILTFASTPQEAIEKEDLSCLQIEPILPYAMRSEEIAHHILYARNLLKSCLSQKLFSCNAPFLQSRLLEELPWIIWHPPKNAPDCVECIILCVSSRENHVENKLDNILKGWLVPGKYTQVLSQTSLHFRWNLFPDTSFLIFQWKGIIENEKDLNHSITHLPSFSTQLTSGLKNPIALKNFFANRPLLQEMKQSQIYEELAGLVERFPHLFTAELFVEMGRLFALCDRSFFEPRSRRLISKIVSFHYLMRLSLTRHLSLYPEQRHIEIRCVQTELDFYFGSKPVLGLILAISPLDNHEFFEESHIAQAVQSLLPYVNTIKSSFCSYQKLHDPICTLYIELEKRDGTIFTTKEIQTLKKSLPEELKRRIEKLVPSIFMTRNEEEVMRNILLLSQELKYLSDIPQVIISLDTQNLSEIVFTIVLVRLVKPNQPPIRKHFETLQSNVQFIPDRTQQVGFLRKNHPKEANVFHLRIAKDPSLLRADYSVNFYLARNKATSILTDTIGPFRDYNGGMILKQGELFYQLQDLFPAVAQKNPELLENFFFSLSPIEAQATLPLSSLKTLFWLFLEAKKEDLSQKEEYFLRIEEKKGQTFAVVRIQDKDFKDDLHIALGHRELLSKALVYNSIQMQGSLYTGLILSHTEDRKRQSFIEALHQAIRSWINKIQNQQVVKLTLANLPLSLDPRLAGEGSAPIIMKMLFEGLTRLDEKGNPTLAIAKSVEISSDLKRYVFRLRSSCWSNGSPITAYDFEYSWKKILSPQFLTPFAYVFYPIKNAKHAKENLCSLNEVGVSSLDSQTLAIELEHPTPEFLELTAHALYSPVHHITDTIHPNWASKGSEDFVCNGPFLVKDIVGHIRYELVKNPLYWDKDSVRLQMIRLSKNSTFTANEMFKKDEIHWMGSSMGSWEFFLENNPEPQIHSAYIGVYLCVFNTEKFPFHNVKLRQAFDYAINREDLVDKIHTDHLPASTPLPLSHTMNHERERALGNEEKALQLFEEALKELGLSRQTFPLLTLNYLNTPLRKKTFAYLRERWKSLFQIPCRLEGFDFNTLHAKMLSGDFQISGLHTKTWIDNPMYSLEIFKYDNLEINVSKWSHIEYQELLHQAKQSLNPIEKVKLLSEAEKVLLREAPVIGLFYEKEKNIAKSYLHQVIHSKTTGHIDFKYAYMESGAK